MMSVIVFLALVIITLSRFGFSMNVSVRLSGVSIAVLIMVWSRSPPWKACTVPVLRFSCVICFMLYVFSVSCSILSACWRSGVRVPRLVVPFFRCQLICCLVVFVSVVFIPLVRVSVVCLMFMASSCSFFGCAVIIFSWLS